MTSNTVPIPDVQTISCADFAEFEEIIKRLRTVDDKIIYELNTTIPTHSFAKDVDIAGRCQQLYTKLKHAYDTRECAIRKCIDETQTNVTRLRHKQEENEDDVNNLKQLRKAQTNLRLLQSEVHIEEVVKDRSIKAFYERCRTAYKPPTDLA